MYVSKSNEMNEIRLSKLLQVRHSDELGEIVLDESSGSAGKASGAPQSSSYFKPSTLENYSLYLTPTFKEGRLDKQCKRHPDRWKSRWFIMQESTLYYFKSEARCQEFVEMEGSTDAALEKANGKIPLDSIISVFTAKECGGTSFTIRVEERTYTLRASNRDLMHDWLFEFQRSIAKIVDAILRVKGDGRSNRMISFNTKHNRRGNRSMSFDCRDLNVATAHLAKEIPCTLSVQSELASHCRSPKYIPQFQRCGSDVLSTTMHANLCSSVLEEEDESTDNGISQTHLRTPPKQIAQKHIKSPIPALKQINSPPLSLIRSTEKYIPPHLRKQLHRGTSNVAEKLIQVQEFQTELPIGDKDTSMFDFYIEEESFGEHTMNQCGVTSLIGVRESMEDVCTSISDFRSFIKATHNASSAQYPDMKESFFAVFDGHSGRQAAAFAESRIPLLLFNHPSFISNPNEALADVFRQVDDEFLSIARQNERYDGTTASVVFRRNSQLFTANVGDSQAVMCVSGVSVPIIEIQNPGRPDEKNRIERCGGWITEEKELHMAKLHQMDLDDPVIRQSAEKVVRWMTVHRVNGELAVSRSIGDPDYKGEGLSEYAWAFPENHSRAFSSNLVIPDPECRVIDLTPDCQFFIVACDGLWDVIDGQQAVDIAKANFERGCTPQEASDSLGQLALRYGSSDNVSVIVVPVKTDM